MGKKRDEAHDFGEKESLRLVEKGVVELLPIPTLTLLASNPTNVPHRKIYISNRILKIWTSTRNHEPAKPK